MSYQELDPKMERQGERYSSRASGSARPASVSLQHARVETDTDPMMQSIHPDGTPTLDTNPPLWNSPILSQRRRLVVGGLVGVIVLALSVAILPHFLSTTHLTGFSPNAPAQLSVNEGTHQATLPIRLPTAAPTPTFRPTLTPTPLLPTPTPAPMTIADTLPTVSCGSSGELCGGTWQTIIQTDTVLQVQFTFSTQQNTSCSSARQHISLDGKAVLVTDWLGWPGATGNFAQLPLQTPLLDLAPVTHGTHTIVLQPEGQVSGCNSGTLYGWTGILRIMKN